MDIYIHIPITLLRILNIYQEYTTRVKGKWNKQKNLLEILPMETLPIEKTDNHQLQARSQRFCCYNFPFVQLVLHSRPEYSCH